MNFNLDFVNSNNTLINYRIEQALLIEKAVKISNYNSLNALKYIVLCLANEGYEVEFDLIITIPANISANIFLPIKETSKKDKLGFYVKWDNITITHNQKSHRFNTSDKIKEYHIKFFGLGIEGFGYKKKNDFNKYLTRIVSFGNLGHKFKSLKYAFYNCKNNIQLPDTLPASIIDMSCMFYECQNLDYNHSLNLWNTSNVKYMTCVFYHCIKFNQSLDSWDTSNVISMKNMFDGCTNYNQSLNTWNVSNVLYMTQMFNHCKNYNQSLNLWNTSNVVDMSCMFNNCQNFNQSLNAWNVSKVKNMSLMFCDCINFDQPLNLWITSNVENMMGMFSKCHNFNQSLNTWNVSNVITMEQMFLQCFNFNQPLSNWNVSSCRKMTNTFKDCTIFNQSLINWNPCNILYNHQIEYIFTNCNISNENKPRFNFKKDKQYNENSPCILL